IKFKKNTEIFPFLYSELEKAKNSIQVAVAWFTDPEILKLLLAKLYIEKLEVTIVVYNDEINVKLNDLKLLKENLRYSFLQDTSIMHHKFVIIDSKTVITGSYNWTIRARNYNRENILQIYDEKIIDEFTLEFKNLCSNSLPQTEVNTHKKSTGYESIEDLNLLSLEQKFNREIFDKIKIAEDLKLSINIPLAYELVRKHTAVIAAAKLATAENGKLIQKALEKLHEQGYLNLSFEESIIKKEFAPIFKNKKIIEFARSKLESLHYFENSVYKEHWNLY
ncbi:MAG: phospholipase D-like domain-containing protein, partial [Chitinophagaceae bacterium]